MEAKLDSAIEEYVTPLSKKYGFTPINRQVTGMGALQDYAAGNLFIRLVNDRGIISFEIAPLDHPEQTWDVTIFEEYLNPPKRGVLNLSLQQQADFLDSHWEWLSEALSESKYEKTLNEISAAGKRRRERIFGA